MERPRHGFAMCTIPSRRAVTHQAPASPGQHPAILAATHHQGVLPIVLPDAGRQPACADAARSTCLVHPASRRLFVIGQPGLMPRTHVASRINGTFEANCRNLPRLLLRFEFNYCCDFLTVDFKS